METPLPYCLSNLTVLSLELQWHETGDMYNGFPDYHSAAQREMVMANAILRVASVWDPANRTVRRSSSSLERKYWSIVEV